jgi:hypothetical protein
MAISVGVHLEELNGTIEESNFKYLINRHPTREYLGHAALKLFCPHTGLYPMKAVLNPQHSGDACGPELYIHRITLLE